MRRILWILPFVVVSFAAAQEVRFVRLEGLSGTLGVAYENTNQTDSDDGSLIRAYDESFIKTELEASVRGYSFHPNFLEFDLNGRFVLSNAQVNTQLGEELGAESYRNNTNTYDLRFSFLKKKAVRFDLFAVQDFDDVGVPFMGRHFNKSRRFGLRGYSNLLNVPVRVELVKNAQTYSSLTADERREDTTLFSISSNFIKTERYRGLFSAEYKDFSEKVFDINYDSLVVNGSLTRSWATTCKNEASVSLFSSDLNGDVNSRVSRLSARYQRKFPGRLQWNTRVSLNQSESTAVKQNDLYLRTELTHDLFKSLHSRVSLDFNNRDAETRTQDRLALGGSISYRKRIPRGMLHINLSQYFEEEQNRSDGILSEDTLLETFDLSDTIILLEPGIDPVTLLLSDPDAGLVFQEGLDFSVVVMDTVIYITRLPGGNIPAGGSVLVRYSFMPAPDYDLSRHRYTSGMRLELFRYFHFGIEKQASHHSVDSLFIVPELEQFDATSYQYGFKSKYVNGEYRTIDYRGVLSSYEGRNWFLTVAKRLGYRYQFSYTMAYNETTFLDMDRFTEFRSSFLTVSFTPLGNLNGTISYRLLEYVNETYESRRESIVGRVNWIIRQLMLTLTYEYILDDSNALDREFSTLTVAVRRRW